MQKNKSKRGIILAEFLMSLGILVAVLVGTCFIFVAAHRLSEDSHQRILALSAASAALETVKNTPIAAVPAINTNGMVPADLPNGQIAITTNPANVANATIATVTVTVTWTGPGGRARNIQMSTMRSNF
jgi:Tfp pilus assembly protein PilX